MVFVSEKRIKDHKNRIKNRGKFPHDDNPIQHENLKSNQKCNNQNISKNGSTYHLSLLIVACKVS
jgi:hypothetical protein